MPPDVLHQIDAAVDGRCVGPGCGIPLTADSPSAWWCSPECQAAWHRQGTDRPEQVRGLRAVAPDLARWRPDLVDTFDDSDLTLVSDQMVSPGGPTRRVYVHRDGRMFLRLDDGWRFVGVFLGQDEYATTAGRGELGEVWRRLERELTDPRRLDTGGPQPDCAGAGAVFWVANPPADPEAPTMAELEGGIDLTPYLAPAIEALLRAVDEYVRLPAEVQAALADLLVVDAHVCQWELVQPAPWDWRRWRRRVDRYRCSLLWSDGTRCDSTTTDPSTVRRTERLVGPSATGGAS